MRKGTSAMSLSRRAAALRAVAQAGWKATVYYSAEAKDPHLGGLVGSDVDDEGVDLDEFARPDRLHALGQSLGVRCP